MLRSIAHGLQAQIRLNLLTNETRSPCVANVGKHFARRAADRESTKLGPPYPNSRAKTEITPCWRRFLSTMSLRYMQLLLFVSTDWVRASSNGLLAWSWLQFAAKGNGHKTAIQQRPEDRKFWPKI